MDDARGDVRWLTYDELAALRGISRDSATRLAMRRRWARRAGNDGKARVAVPLDPDRPPHDAGVTSAPDSHPDESSNVRVMTDDTSPRHELVEVLRAQVADLIRRLDAAEERHRADSATWNEERGRLLALIERSTERAAGEGATIIRAEVAERRAAELEAIINGDLAGLREMVAALAERERAETAGSRRPRRPGLLGRLFGR